MKKTIATREDVHECTELGDVHNAALVHLTNFSGRRVENETDLTLGLAHCTTIGRTDADATNRTIVVDTDVGAGFLLDGVDDLALRTNNFTDLVHRDFEADDLRCGFANLFARSRNGTGHNFEDRKTGFFGLLQSLCKNVGGDAVDLGVELQCRHELRRTSNLEVHVAEGIFSSEDVGKGRVLAIGKHEAHGDTSDRCTQRNAGVHHRKG
ncbi:unannotated protein [freshwater metagenome]|uniref:Unannotated protein n=1 Tax=freshwater metagenome TaxID=449393 RepID=A0A6J6KM09_9ZZZZ